MSFMDSAAEVLDRAEASLHSLIADALKAKAYRDVTEIASMAESLAAVSSGRSKNVQRTTATLPEVTFPAVPETAKASEPSWMRPKA